VVTKRHTVENPENLTDEQLLEKVKDDNDALELDLAERTMGRVIPGPAQDTNRMLIYLKFILLDLGILVTAELEFEAMRAEKLEVVRAEVEKHEKQGGLFVPPPAGPKILGPKA
jgi:hypothetical protein